MNGGEQGRPVDGRSSLGGRVECPEAVIRAMRRGLVSRDDIIASAMRESLAARATVAAELARLVALGVVVRPRIGEYRLVRESLELEPPEQ